MQKKKFTTSQQSCVVLYLLMANIFTLDGFISEFGVVFISQRALMYIRMPRRILSICYTVLQFLSCTQIQSDTTSTPASEGKENSGSQNCRMFIYLKT